MSDNSLTDLLLYYVYMEQEINIMREMLCSEQKLCTYNLFKMIDCLKEDPKGFLTQFDLAQYLKNMKFPSNLPVQVYIQNYNQNYDGNLVYSEFLKAILPTNNQKIREQITQQDPQSNYIITDKMQYLFAKLLEGEIKLTIQAETYKRHQNLEIFYQIQENGYITHQRLQQYFNSRHINTTPIEIQLIFNRLDILNDGKIDQQEWKLYTVERRQLNQINTLSYRKQLPSHRYSSAKRKQNDTTMSDLESIAKTGYMSAQKPPIYGTPSKYRNQKTQLRAEMQLSLLFNESNKKQNPSSQKDSYYSTNKKTQHFTIEDGFETQKKKSLNKSLGQISSDPLSYLMNFFQKLIDAQEKIERHKILLCEHDDFSLFSCFQKLDKGSKGYLNQNDLKNYFRNQQLILKQYGKENKCRFSEFIKMVEPRDNYSLQMIQMRESGKNPRELGPQTMLTLKMLFELIEFQEMQIEESKNCLKKSQISTKDLFYLLSYDKQRIVAQDLLDFFQVNNRRASEDEIAILMEKLDQDEDGQINYRDFTHFFGLHV